MSHAVDGDTARWAADIPPAMAERLGWAGLLPPRTTPREAVGGFLSFWLAAGSQYKPASRLNWQQAHATARNANRPRMRKPLFFRGLRHLAAFCEMAKWRRWESNPRPQHCERCALPIELRPRGTGGHLAPHVVLRPLYSSGGGEACPASLRPREAPDLCGGDRRVGGAAASFGS